MKFFYSAGAMGYGSGYWWHKFFNFPRLPFITKTLTLLPKKGNKYLILPTFNSVFNNVGLDNMALGPFLVRYGKYVEDRTISLAGRDINIEYMLMEMDLPFISRNIDNVPCSSDVELNFSCPNVKSFNNRIIPKTNRNIYLKLNWTQDPYDYDLDRVKGIRLNSVPLKFCGGSGKIAQKRNWGFIYKFNKEGLNVAGCSAQSFKDIKILKDIGCTEIGIGSAMLTHPKFVERLRKNI